MAFTFTAVQIVNRFLEVFALPQSTKRILSIGELFASDAKMASLKNAQKIYLDGAEKISNSFLLAEPINATLSKRIFIDAIASGKEDSSAVAKKEEERSISSSSVITFCLDFHRAGTSPGLGDVSKPTVLLYRCNSEHITSVWGMVDKEGLANSTDDLTLERMESTAAWKLSLAHVLVDMPDVLKGGTSQIHFHNYDKIDVWG
jgi:hypothetical protein